MFIELCAITGIEWCRDLVQLSHDTRQKVTSLNELLFFD